MVTFKVVPHSVKDDAVIEVWEDGHMISVIYPADRGVRLVSKYLPSDSAELMKRVVMEPGTNQVPVAAVNIQIWDGVPKGPVVVGGRLW